MAKSPRFFCEHCGAEVARNAGKCPRCGRFFGSVRCPACGFTGAEGLFASGCPACGYSAPGSGAQSRSGGKKFFPRKKKSPLVAAGALPLWVYVLTVFFLISIFGAFFFTFR